MINNQNGIYNLLKAEPLIPVVAIENYKQLDEIVKSLLERKIFCIEITLRTPFSWQAIERAKLNYGELLKIGVGTVISKNQINKAKDFGVDFIVSPGTTDALLEELVLSKTPFLPGVSTVSDILRAIEYKCDFLKFYPAPRAIFRSKTGLRRLPCEASLWCPEGFLWLQPGGVGLGGSRSFSGITVSPLALPRALPGECCFF